MDDTSTEAPGATEAPGESGEDEERDPEPGAPRLDRLPWPDVTAHLRRDPRLVLPVGTVLQHGPHLPLSTDTVIVERLAREVCARRRVLLAPTVAYGVCSRAEADYAGTSPLEPKTLHRVLNELVGAWESQGVEEIVLLTAHGYGRHMGALASVMSESARIRAVDLTTVDLESFRTGASGPEHAGEVETSLMLHLAPELVWMERAEDVALPAERMAELTEGPGLAPPPGGVGIVGTPTRATAENGRRIYEHLVETLDKRIFAPT
jgi:creatinine amidohydrolase